MRKLIVHEFVTLDGVMQAPGGKDEERALKAQPGKTIVTDGSTIRDSGSGCGARGPRV